MAAARKTASGKNAKNSLIDVAADLIGGSGLDLDTVIDMATGAGTSKKKSGSSKKKDSKSDSLISKLIPEKVEYPQFSEKTYWAIREKFQKSIPEKVIASTLTNATGLKADTIKTTVLPALTLMGLLKDGKPTTKLKTWVNDSKYEEACESIRGTVYPASLTKLGFNTTAQQTSVLNWFKKNADVSETTAKKMMAVYLLLSAPKLKTTAASVVKKTVSTVTKKADSATTKKTADSASAKKTAAPASDVKVAVKSGKATITVKVVVEEGITKKALTEQFTALAAEAYKQMK